MNRHLGHWYTIPRLEAMLGYLRRHTRRMEELAASPITDDDWEA